MGVHIRGKPFVISSYECFRDKLGTSGRIDEKLRQFSYIFSSYKEELNGEFI